MSDLCVRHSSAELARQFGISDTSLKNYFRHTYGCGYREYQNRFRMRAASAYLETTDKKVVEIAQLVGYASQAKFSTAFKKFYGMTPQEYRRTKRIQEADRRIV